MSRLAALCRHCCRLSAEGLEIEMVAVLEGVGAWLPPTVVTNETICTRLGVTSQWITERTGILERRTVTGGMASADLAVEAGARALESAQRSSVDVVLVVTTSPDRLGLAIAPEVAHRLGLNGVPAFDLNAACSGFIYGLATATGLVDAAIADHVLLICADAFSTFVNPSDPDTAPIFGDGAGAVVIRGGSAGEPGAFGLFDLGSDGGRADLLAVPGVGSRHRSANGRMDAVGENAYLVMSGGRLYLQAIRRMASSARAILAKTGWSIDDVDCFVAHQANALILEAVATELGLPPERVASNISQTGNTVAASIPILLSDLARQHKIKPGARMLLTAFGSGLSWGSTTLTWRSDLGLHGK